METQIEKTILRKNNRAGGIMLLDFRFYCKATFTKTVWYQYKNRCIVKRIKIEIPRRNPHIHGQIIYNKAIKNIQWGKKSLQQMLLGKWDSYLEKNQSGLLCHTIPRWCRGKESACQCRRRKRHRFNPWVRKIHWNRKWQPTPVCLPGKSHRQRTLVGYRPQGCKEMDTTE